MTLAKSATWLCGCWFGLRGLGTSLSSGTNSSKAQLTAGPRGGSGGDCGGLSGVGSGTAARFSVFVRSCVKSGLTPTLLPSGGCEKIPSAHRPGAGAHCLACALTVLVRHHRRADVAPRVAVLAGFSQPEEQAPKARPARSTIDFPFSVRA